jgi:hypothetical protein
MAHRGCRSCCTMSGGSVAPSFFCPSLRPSVSHGPDLFHRHHGGGSSCFTTVRVTCAPHSFDHTCAALKHLIHNVQSEFNGGIAKSITAEIQLKRQPRLGCSSGAAGHSGGRHRVTKVSEAHDNLCTLACHRRVEQPRRALDISQAYSSHH